MCTKDTFYHLSNLAMYPVQTVELVQPYKRASDSNRVQNETFILEKKTSAYSIFLHIDPLSGERNGALGGLIGCAVAAPSRLMPARPGPSPAASRPSARQLAVPADSPPFV
jgi:hypothetical protein